jgi:hypothetical protein
MLRQVIQKKSRRHYSNAFNGNYPPWDGLKKNL